MHPPQMMSDSIPNLGVSSAIPTMTCRVGLGVGGVTINLGFPHAMPMLCVHSGVGGGGPTPHILPPPQPIWECLHTWSGDWGGEGGVTVVTLHPFEGLPPIMHPPPRPPTHVNQVKAR